MHKIIYNYHKSVLIREVVESIINAQIKDVYVDVTFGGGGHSSKLLRKLSSKTTLLAFDLDKQAIINNTLTDNRLKIFHRNYRYIEKILRIQGIFKVSGIIADLGVSSYQLDTHDRGFSIRYNQILDMRMDQRILISAKQILNNYSYESLTKIFFYYGEIRNAKILAANIIYKRQKIIIENSFELIEIIKNEITGRNKPKFFAKVFQALRIEVNDEFTSIKYFFKSIINILRKGAKIVVISYHSLEDRVIKQLLTNRHFEKTKIVKFSKKTEIKKNPRSKSSILRIAKKK